MGLKVSPLNLTAVRAEEKKHPTSQREKSECELIIAHSITTPHLHNGKLRVCVCVCVCIYITLVLVDLHGVLHFRQRFHVAVTAVPFFTIKLLFIELLQGGRGAGRGGKEGERERRRRRKRSEDDGWTDRISDD